MCDEFRLRFDRVGELVLEGFGNPTVELLTFPSQQARVRRILQERVLEYVRAVRRLTLAEDNFGSRELRQGVLQQQSGARSHAREQSVGELTADRSRYLRDLFDGSEPVETRHQRIVQRRRDGWTTIDQPFTSINQQPGLHHGLGKFLDEQGNAIGLTYDLLVNVGRQHLSACDVDDDGASLVASKAIEPEHGHIRPVEPRREEFRPESYQEKYGNLFDRK